METAQAQAGAVLIASILPAHQNEIVLAETEFLPKPFIRVGVGSIKFECRFNHPASIG